MAQRKRDYWKRRFAAIENASNAYGQEIYRQIEPAFNQAQREIQAEIDSWISRVAKNNQVSFTEARRLLTTKELAEFKWDVNEFIKYGEDNVLDPVWMKQLENASARHHINRLEALNIRAQQAMEKAFGNELDSIDSMARRLYSDNYYHSVFEIQKGFNIGWDIAEIDERKLDKLISKPWAADGKNFSNRVWQSKTSMVNELHNELVRTCILGKSPDEAIKHMTKFVDKKFSNAKVQAGRLVMTEQAFFASAAQQECFNDLDVEEYEIVATLDSLTSVICQNLDGKHFPMKDYQPGVTAPPFHVWCRSITVPWFEDNYGGERAARGADGKTYYVPDNMSYEEWKKTFVDGGSKDDLNAVTDSDTIKGNNYLKNYDSDLAKKFGTDYYDALHEKVVNCPNETLAKVWKQNEAKILVGDAKYKGHEHCRGNTIYVNGVRDSKGGSWQSPYQVTFHESGHAIDSLNKHKASGYGSHFSSRYKDGLFPNTIKDEVSNMVSDIDKRMKAEFKLHKNDFDWLHSNGYIGDWNYNFFKQHGKWIGGTPKYSKSKAYYALEQQIRKIPALARSDLSDIIEGATGAKVKAGFGHGASYWKSRTTSGVDDGLSTEAFAEMIDSAMTNPESLEIIKEYLPKSYEVFEEMLKALL